MKKESIIALFSSIIYLRLIWPELPELSYHNFPLPVPALQIHEQAIPLLPFQTSKIWP